MDVNLDVGEIMTRYETRIAQLTRELVLAESRSSRLEQMLQEALVQNTEVPETPDTKK